MANKHGKHHYTGPVHHPAEMHDHLPGVEDKHAHESHKSGHKEFGNAGAPVVGHESYHDNDAECGGAIGDNECDD